MKHMEDKKMIWGGVIVGLVIIGISFWGGYAYAQARITAARTALTASRTGGVGGRFGAGGRGGSFAGGKVISIDATSMTIQGTDGSSKIVLITPTTPVMKTITGALTDVTVGSNVTITGTPNPDGSVSAQSIQIRPAMMQQAQTQGATPTQ